MKERNDILVGAFVLLGVAMIAAGSLWLAGDRWGGEDRFVTARFQRVGELRTGSQVSVRGVDVGRVVSIELTDGSGVDVVLRLRREVRLPDQPLAVVRPSSVFGQWGVEIVPASTVTDVERDTLAVPEGRIPGYTQADFAQIADFTEDIARNLRSITNKLELAITERTASDVAASVENFRRTTEEMVALAREQRRQVSTVSEDVAVVADRTRRMAVRLDSTLARVDGALAGKDLDSIVAHTRSATAALARLGGRLDRTADDLDGVLARADSTFVGADRILRRVNRGEGTLGMLLADTLLYEQTSATLGELRALLDDLRRNPSRYFSFSIF